MLEKSMRIEQTSIAEMVAEKIRIWIMNQTLKSGDKLREVELSKQLNVSRTPVREAFRILQSEGLVVHNPRSGVVVASVGVNDVVQLYEVRGVLEVLSAYHAAQNTTQELVEELRRINSEMLRCAIDAPEKARECDLDFHITIARWANNPTLEDQLGILHRKTRIVLNFVPFSKDRIPYSCKEHDDVIAAIEEGKEDVASKYMEIHFHESTESLKNKVIVYNSKII